MKIHDADPDAPNPLLEVLPTPEALASTNDDMKAQHQAVMAIYGSLGQICDYAIAEALADPARDMTPVNIVGATIETALLERYGETPDVIARILVSGLLDRSLERVKPGPQQTAMAFEHEGRLPLVLLHNGLGLLLRSRALAPEHHDLAVEIRDELATAISRTPRDDDAHTPEEESHEDAASDAPE